MKYREYDFCSLSVTTTFCCKSSGTNREWYALSTRLLFTLGQVSISLKLHTLCAQWREHSESISFAIISRWRTHQLFQTRQSDTGSIENVYYLSLALLPRLKFKYLFSFLHTAARATAAAHNTHQHNITHTDYVCATLICIPRRKVASYATLYVIQIARHSHLSALTLLLHAERVKEINSKSAAGAREG